MTPAQKRVMAAAAALAAYAAGCAPTKPEPFNAAADTEKLDYARPHSIEDADDYIVPRQPRARASRSRPAGLSRLEEAPAGSGCTLEDIKRLESGGNYQAQNPRSTASGAYQVLNSTWNGYAGYQRAADAPPEIQDQFARELYARRGSQPWVVCR